MRACSASIAILTWLLGACVAAPGATKASAPRAMNPPGAATNPRAEIEQLSREIERWSRGEPIGDDAIDYAGADDGADDVAPMSRSPGDVPAGPRRALPLSEPLECPDGSAPTSAVCNDVCTLARSICANAERICRLAGELPGDDWARGKCESAEQSCREATERCCGCEAGE